MLKILTMSRAVNAHGGITRREGRSASEEITRLLSASFAHLQGQALHASPNVLAASCLTFLPNLWSSSGVSLATQGDEIQQILWDFWCLLTPSGGLGLTSPYLLTWGTTISSHPSSSPATHTTRVCLEINMILLAPVSAAPGAPGTGFSRKGINLVSSLWACLGFRAHVENPWNHTCH